MQVEWVERRRHGEQGVPERAFKVHKLAQFRLAERTAELHGRDFGHIGISHANVIAVNTSYEGARHHLVLDVRVCTNDLKGTYVRELWFVRFKPGDED